METFGIYMMHGDAPMFGENNHRGRVRRGAISTASTEDRRSSAPPRPPRPELNPWPKEMFTTSIAEITNDDLYVHRHDFADGSYTLRPQDFAPEPKEQYSGRISPVSEEALSSAGSNSSNVSPSNSLNKSLLDRPVLRRRPFSFESIRSAASCYSQIVDMYAESQNVVGSEDFTEYADIAMSNPYAFQSEIDAMRPYASHTYEPEPETELEEPVIYSSDVKSASQVSLARSQTIVVPMSRYNSQDSQQSNHISHRAPPPSPAPDTSEQEKTLDEAWEDVKRAVAPKLKVAIPPPTTSNKAVSVTPPTSAKEASPASRISTEHALPPSPPPPPVPARNPRRTSGASRNKSGVTSANRSQHLSQSYSSPNISEAYKQQSDVSDVPPVPALPSVQRISLLPAKNMPMHVPAPLPTPAASEFSDSAHSLPSPISVRRASARLSHEHARASRLNIIPQSPISPLSVASRHSMGQSSSSQLSDQSSPRSRGFHEPPPVAPPAARANTVRYPPSHMPAHKMTRSDSNFVSTPGIYTGNGANLSSFTTEIWAGGSPPPAAKMSRGATLRSILPGESATRSSYLPPKAPGRSQTQPMIPTPTTAISTTSSAHSQSSQRESVVLGTNGNHIVASSSKPSSPADLFPPFRTIPLPPGSKTGPTDDHLPKFSNNFSGFCKCAWRHQTSQTNKAFKLRTVTQKSQLSNATTTTTKTTTLSCKRCSFEGPLTHHPSGVHAALSAGPGYAAPMDLATCADKTPHTAHGVVYRWSFLFKSHLGSKTVLRRDEVMSDEARDEREVYGCLFCCAEGKGTVCFEGAKNLCGHISKCHAMGVGNGNRELGMRVGIVVGRRPEKGEGWDIILPGRRERDERAVRNWL